MLRNIALVAALAVLVCGAARGADLTADDVLKKTADTYKNMKSYYEVADFTRSMETPGGEGPVRREEETTQVTTALKRPDTLILRIRGRETATIALQAGALTIYNPSTREYVRQQDVEMRQLANSLEYPIVAVAASEDPYKAMKEDFTGEPQLSETDYQGRPVYSVAFKQGEDVTVTYLIDKAGFYIAAVEAVATQAGDNGTSSMKVAMKTSKVLINQAPEGEDSMFAFALPAEAKEINPQSPEEATMQLEGKPAPDFTLEKLSGGRVSLADLKGKVVLLDFWATWCPPCREELPILVNLAQEYKDKPFAYYAIDDTESMQTVKAFIQEIGIEVPALVGQNREVSGKYNIVAIPTLFVIDKAGVVRNVFIGQTAAEELKAAIDPLLK